MSNSKDCKTNYERVAYVLQGGGALGAYQLGACEALHEHGYEPDWVVGTSIGAINGAIIVGNVPEKRIERLREFWNRIATPDFMPATLFDNSHMKTWHSHWGAQMALLFGQEGFFKPKAYNPWLIMDAAPDGISFYDTGELKNTLEELIDFDYLNDSKIVLKVGAVLINEGRLKYFNNKKNRLGPEHIMASCALPPGFPAVKIDGEYYWDAGVQSNTPLNVVLDARPHKNTLCFMIDLFSSIGRLPRSMADVMERQKDIQYSSHSKRATKLYSTRQNLRRAIALLGEKLPEEVKQQKEIRELLRLGSPKNIDVAHLVYDPPINELESKDYNFAKTSLSSHVKAGYDNAIKLFAEAPWLHQSYDKPGVTVYTAPDNPQQEEEEFYD